MAEFLLTCCSTADMPLAYMEEKELPYICYKYTIDGKDYPDDLGQTLPIASFYEKIENGAMPTTSQVNETQFIEFFEPFLQAGQDILHVELSSGISGTYGQALAAQKALNEKYPDRKLYVVDSLAASSGYGLLVDALVDMRDNGVGIEEAHRWVEDNKLNVHHWVFTTDLTHFKRGGRISAASATFGSMFKICPIINVSNEGKLLTRAKARGKKNAVRDLLKRMEDHAVGGLDYNGKCFISNSACYDDAKMMADAVKETFAHINGDVMINDIGTVIGAHTGPGTVALFFFGDKRVD